MSYSVTVMTELLDEEQGLSHNNCTGYKLCCYYCRAHATEVDSDMIGNPAYAH
jgi:MinD superfamily P-loop ATPase